MGLVVSWAGRLIAERSTRAIADENESTLTRLRSPVPVSGGIMESLSQLANLGLTLVGFGLPFITIYLLYRLVRNTERPSSGSNPWPTAIELLDAPFARAKSRRRSTGGGSDYSSKRI
jgi:hypothetical protein